MIGTTFQYQTRDHNTADGVGRIGSRNQRLVELMTLRYRYPRAGPPPDGRIRVVLHADGLLNAVDRRGNELRTLADFRRESEFTIWWTPASSSEGASGLLEAAPILLARPPNPDFGSNFSIEIPLPEGRGTALGRRRWNDDDLDLLFGVRLGTQRYSILREALLALDIGAGIRSHLFVTLNNDLLARRDWLQDRFEVFIVSLSEALDFIDVHLKRMGTFVYRPSFHVSGTHAYYFGRVCQAIPAFASTWTSVVVGDAELPNGQQVRRYLESFALRLISMFEAKDRVADQFYRPADNNTTHHMTRELNAFFPLVTGTFDALGWLARHLYGFGTGSNDKDQEFRRRVVIKLQPGRSTNGLISHIETANKPLAKLLRSKQVQDLLNVFYPARDSIQHRHPFVGVGYAWIEDRGRGVRPAFDDGKAFSLAILDGDTATAIQMLDKEDSADYFSDWGLRWGGVYRLLEPYKFVRHALRHLIQFYQNFFLYLDLAAHSNLSPTSSQEIWAIEAERTADLRRTFEVPFLMSKDIPAIAGGLAQVMGNTPRAGEPSSASDRRSIALHGAHPAILDVAQLGKGSVD